MTKPIISLVSLHNRAGKSEGARAIEKAFAGVGWYSFAFNLNKATSLFLGKSEGRSKYDVHPELGVTFKEVNHLIADALQKRHPELSVWRTKKEIEWSMENESLVVIDDTRRQREFDWLDELAAKHGTKHHVIEVVPVGAQLEKATLDMWSNGIELCGHEVWVHRNRPQIDNDGTENYEKAIVKLVQSLLED